MPRSCAGIIAPALHRGAGSVRLRRPARFSVSRLVLYPTPGLSGRTPAGSRGYPATAGNTYPSPATADPAGVRFLQAVVEAAAGDFGHLPPRGTQNLGQTRHIRQVIVGESESNTKSGIPPVDSGDDSPCVRQVSARFSGFAKCKNRPLWLAVISRESRENAALKEGARIGPAAVWAVVAVAPRSAAVSAAHRFSPVDRQLGTSHPDREVPDCEPAQSNGQRAGAMA